MSQTSAISASGTVFLAVVSCQLLIQVLKTNQVLGPGKTVIIIYSGVSILMYWKSPRPRSGFLKHVYLLATCLSFFLLAFHFLPLEFSKRMPIYMAFGLPTFFMASSLYWALPSLFSKDNSADKPRLSLWILGSLGFAIFCAWSAWNQEDPFRY